MIKKIVITGPTGAIGMALILSCIARQIEVLAICHKNSKRIKYIPESKYVKIKECDLSDLKNYKLEQNDSYEVFYHLGWSGTFGDARNDMQIQVHNIEYTLDAVSLAERFGCHTFIGAGSQAEYGVAEDKLTPQTSTNPQIGYGIAKLCAGQASRILCGQKKIKHIWTRILSVYGPYDGWNTMITYSIRSFLNNSRPVYTQGEQQWDYLYSFDAAKMLLLAGEVGIDQSIYCLGSGKTRSLAEYIMIIKNAINKDLSVGIGEIPYSENQVMYLCADIDNIKKDLNYEPDTCFEDGIFETIEWCRNILHDEKRGEYEE